MGEEFPSVVPDMWADPNGWATTEFLSSITINCPTCGKGFVPRTKRQRYCCREHSRNSRRSERREEHELEFIGVDGEGVNVIHDSGSKTHHYVMLSVGDATLFRGGRELTHTDIFPFLYGEFMGNESAAYVGFFLGYDFSMWLKSLPVDRARYLFNPALRKRRDSPNPVPFPVYLDGWEFDILGMKRFKLRPHTRGKNTNPWLYVCDTGAYFQTSFLNVINPDPEKWPTGAPCTEEEYAIVKEGKEDRATEITEGDVSYLPTMQRYNQLENRILSRTCAILNRGFSDAGVSLKRDAFYGPGQAIQLWLNDKAKAGHLVSRQQLEEIIPDYAIAAGRASYYGGWFEIPYHGHVPGESYEYDITSAYPHAMRDLPCLCGPWSYGGANDIPELGIFTILRARITGSNTSLGAMPFRNPKGNILRPNDLVGWYFEAEIRASQRAGLIDTVDVLEWVTYHGCGHDKPLAEMATLFQQRLKIGKQTPTGKAIKLMLNSGYGKFAQSIGSPKYGNPIYASLITSVCRTMILEAIGTHPVGAAHVLMVATDGLYFRTRHPELDAHASEQLGGWEPGVKHNLTLMKPGVYWDDKARAAISKDEIADIKSRGISAESLSKNITAIDRAFTDLQSDLSQPFPSLNITVPFSVTSPRLALARGKWETAGAVDWDVPRTDSASIAPKRTHPYHDGDYIRSFPMVIPPGTETTPYNKSFGYIAEDDIFGYTQEGSVLDAIADIGKLDD